MASWAYVRGARGGGQVAACHAGTSPGANRKGVTTIHTC
jgi:hypothetical protein